jgi:monoamine oxidase
MLDYVIIGGGIAGLYANTKLAKKKKNGILLEKNSDISGRVKEYNFHNVVVKTGAGICVPENKTLVKLLKKFGMSTKIVWSPAVVDKRLPPFDMKNAVKQIKKIYKKITKKDLATLTAREVLYKYFDKEFAEQFIHHSEFHDWINGGSFEYLFKYYDIDDLDNVAFGKIFVDWTMLVEKLKLPNIRTDYTVTKVEKKGKIFVINDDIETKEVIFAVTVSTIDAIKCVGFNMPTMSDFLGSTPFSRVYAYYKDGYSMKEDYVMVDGVVNKVVKINKNVLMASYADGDTALFWKNVKEMPLNARRRIVQDELADIGYDFGLPDDVFSAEWTDGVHYVKPYKGTFDKLLDKLSKPAKGVTIVGEMLSKRIGYVEGALLSVERAIK